MQVKRTNINDRFFDSIYKEIWKGIIPPGLTEVESEFLMDVCSLDKNSSVLDLMCGYGRHSLELARKGVSVTAVDNLLAYIDELDSEARSEGLPVQAIQSSVLDMELTSKFDAAICMGNSFSFFPKDEVKQLLSKLSDLVKNGGTLIINSWMIAEIAIKYFKEREWHDIKGYKYILDYNFQFLPNRIESEQTIISPGGQIEMIEGVDYIYSLDEISTMLNQAGFKVTSLYSTPKKKKFMLGDGRIYIVAEKI
jgi:cyclopropane fatty-acyl-phospholipid synthase-like methyltransferase